MAKKLVWAFWIVMTIALGAYFSYLFFKSEEKDLLLIGETTHGHYQIELACSACHTDAFGGTEALQTACLNCHQTELVLADDSHPKSKFTDPRNADRVEILDARYCITCHGEHKQDATFVMGLTLPEDYCFHCHQEIAEERPSHEDLGFYTCATSGCHNYHDNRALYEDFLIEHSGQADFLDDPVFARLFKPAFNEKSLNAEDNDAPQEYRQQNYIDDWDGSAHALAGINCSDCHQQNFSNLQNTQTANTWIERPGLNECRECHEFQVEGFTAGKHGMRLSEKVRSTLDKPLSAMTPSKAQQHNFKSDSHSHQQNCNACHNSHEFNTQYAAVDACLNCHNDDHSLNFLISPHGQMWSDSLTSSSMDKPIVSCSTCHLPRVETNPSDPTEFHVQHNQNDNLRPNEKMIRDVCMDCHGLRFSIDSLADTDLIKNNFKGRAKEHIPSIDMALDRVKKE